MSAESEGQMQRDYFYDVNRIGEALLDPQTIGRRAAERAVRRLGARPVPTCEVPVLFAPELATGLFGHFIAAISGGNLYRKRSEEHTSELKSLMRIPYAVFCLKKHTPH